MTKKMTKKKLKEYVHDKDRHNMNISGEALDVLVGMEKEKAEKIADQAAKIAKSVNRKTIQRPHVDIVISLLDYVHHKPNNDRDKVTKKALKERAHDKEGLGMNISLKALEMLSGMEESRAYKVLDEAGALAKSIKRKTIKDTQVQTIQEVLNFFESS
jgi:histone H3/H4